VARSWVDAAVGVGLGTPSLTETFLASWKKFIVTLTDDDRQKIEQVLAEPEVSPNQQNRAQILLLSADGMKAVAIAERLGVTTGHISRVRNQFVEQGLEAVLGDPHRPGPAVGAWSKISPEVAKEAGELHEQGSSFRELAKKYDVSPEGIRIAINRQKENDIGLGR
jgi:transposase